MQSSAPLVAPTSNPYPFGRLEFAVLLASVITFAYYLFVLAAGADSVFSPIPAGLNFNSMLEHMLRGEFDVDPDAIGFEGFPRDGRIYSYFGPFAAVVRLPLVPLGLLPSLDITRISCALALTVVVWAKLRTLLLLFLSAPAPKEMRATALCVALGVCFGGLQVQLLQTMIFNEPTSWAYAFSSLYIWMLLRGLLRQGYIGRSDYAWLAVMAGLALSARVTAGVALYSATGALMLAEVWNVFRQRERVPFGRLTGRWLTALVILGGAAMVIAYVNYQRWGNPFIFLPARLQLLNAFDPRRITVEDIYGNLNPIRVPLNFQYYFFPIWLFKSDGQFLLQEYFLRLYIGAELRPVAIPISDPALVFLCGFWAAQARSRTAWVDLPRPPVLAALAGLMSSAILVLLASAVASRYRSELYPVMDLAAWAGLYMILQNQGPRNRASTWVSALSIAGILTAHLFSTFYMGAHFESFEHEWTAPSVAHALYWDIVAALRRFGMLGG